MQPLCSLCLCGEVQANHRDTEDTEVAQRNILVNLRFHWMLPKSGEVVLQGSQTPREAARFRVESTRVDSPAAKPEMEGWVHFAQQAEKAGIESVLVALNRYEPDPLMISCALGRATKQLKFIVAYRSGLMQPTTFVQQVNTLSGLIDGRIDLNIPLGTSGWFNGDFNYDGKVNVDDYGIIDFNVGIQGAPFPTAAAAPSVEAVTSVPEPAGLISLVMGAAVITRRRRTCCP